jgi:trk system potassium uptake protein TrkA
MYVAILGAGRVGSTLASRLLESGSEVVAIDSDKGKADLLNEAVGKICILGDGSSLSVLEDAGLSRVDVFIATTGQDHINLIVCQIAKGKYNVQTTVSVLNQQDNEKLFELAGIDLVADVPRLVIGEIETGLAPLLVEEV